MELHALPDIEFDDAIQELSNISRGTDDLEFDDTGNAPWLSAESEQPVSHNETVASLESSAELVAHNDTVASIDESLQLTKAGDTSEELSKSTPLDRDVKNISPAIFVESLHDDSALRDTSPGKEASNPTSDSAYTSAISHPNTSVTEKQRWPVHEQLDSGYGATFMGASMAGAPHRHSTPQANTPRERTALSKGASPAAFGSAIKFLSPMGSQVDSPQTFNSFQHGKPVQFSTPTGTPAGVPHGSSLKPAAAKPKQQAQQPVQSQLATPQATPQASAPRQKSFAKKKRAPLGAITNRPRHRSPRKAKPEDIVVPLQAISSDTKTQPESPSLARGDETKDFSSMLKFDLSHIKKRPSSESLLIARASAL